jgi:hypothetical protein
MTRFYQLYPWDVERLTADELNEYLRQFDQHQREQRLAAAKAKRGQPRRR